MEYRVRTIVADSQKTAVVRLRARQQELSRVVPEACGEVWNYLRTVGAPRPGRHVALYLDGEINLEVGVEMDQDFLESDRVCRSCTPAGLVATTGHFGPYHLLGEAHKAILLWCAHHGHAPAAQSWEIYGHWNDDPAQLRTDVFYLLRDAGDQETRQAGSQDASARPDSEDQGP